MFNLAEYCHKTKHPNSLEKLVNEVKEVSGGENIEIESCETILYKIILCVEKCLPNYPTRYYARNYIEKPSFFHLYFFPDIL